MTKEITIWWYPEVLVKDAGDDEFRRVDELAVRPTLLPLYARAQVSENTLADPESLQRAIHSEAKGVAHDLGNFVRGHLSDQYVRSDNPIVDDYAAQIEAVFALALSPAAAPAS